VKCTTLRKEKKKKGEVTKAEPTRVMAPGSEGGSLSNNMGDVWRNENR